MSHQVVITFDIDENKVAENAEKEAGRQIAREVIEGAFGHAYNKDRLMREYVAGAILSLLETDKERIINEAVRNLTESLKRSKAVRDKIAEATE